MKNIYLTCLAISLLALPSITLAQPSSYSPPLGAAGTSVASSNRTVLGGPPQPALAPADTASLYSLWRLLEQTATETTAACDARLEVSLQAARQLAQQLATTQQQLADLRRQLVATRKLYGELLADRAELTELRQQLNLLRSQQAASTGRRYRVLGWPLD